MICHLCKEDKLSKEFPFEQLTDDCHHPLLHCLRCAIASVECQRKCSQCDSRVAKENEKYQDYVDALEYLYPKIEDDADVSRVTYTGSKLFITPLSGESIALSYNPVETILALKRRIELNLKIPSDKQLLLYQNNALKNTKENMTVLTLRDYGVPANSKLQLIIVLYAVPEGLDHVIFDLYWGFPDTQTTSRYGRKDFLDASVLLYDGSDYLDVVDFRHRMSSYTGASVTHSGWADMDYHMRQGHQKINVHIKSIPDKIDNLIFTLSAWNSPNVSKYRNPSLKFYDVKFPNKMLCTDEMSYVNHSQAIVMCCLSRKGGQWVAKSVKRPASGNTRNYSLLRSNIASLIPLIQQGVI